MENKCKNCKFWKRFPEGAFQQWGVDGKRFGGCLLINHIDERHIYDDEGNIVGSGLSGTPETNSINIIDYDPTYWVLVGEDFGCVNFVKRED